MQDCAMWGAGPHVGCAKTWEMPMHPPAGAGRALPRGAHAGFCLDSALAACGSLDALFAQRCLSQVPGGKSRDILICACTDVLWRCHFKLRPGRLYQSAGVHMHHGRCMCAAAEWLSRMLVQHIESQH